MFRGQWVQNLGPKHLLFSKTSFGKSAVSLCMTMLQEQEGNKSPSQVRLFNFSSLHKRLIYVVTLRKLQIIQTEMVALPQHLFCLYHYYLPSTDNEQPVQKGYQVVNTVSKATPKEGWSQSWKVNIYLCTWLLSKIS